MELFMKFVATLIGDYGKYLKQDQFDLVKDGVSYRQVELNLSDEEYLQLLQGLRARMMQHVGNEPSDERRRRLIATIVIPEVKRSKNLVGMNEELND
jgi:hypothetical protein